MINWLVIAPVFSFWLVIDSLAGDSLEVFLCLSTWVIVMMRMLDASYVCWFQRMDASYMDVPVYADVHVGAFVQLSVINWLIIGWVDVHQYAGCYWTLLQFVFAIPSRVSFHVSNKGWILKCMCGCFIYVCWLKHESNYAYTCTCICVHGYYTILAD